MIFYYYKFIPDLKLYNDFLNDENHNDNIVLKLKDYKGNEKPLAAIKKVI